MDKKTDIVINVAFGGFCLPIDVVKRMAELGNPEAIEEVKRPSFNSKKYSCTMSKTPRHDPVLIQAVKEFGEKANTDLFCTLVVKTIQGDKYFIREHDGFETVIEPKDIKWIEV